MYKIDYDMIKDDMTTFWVDGREHFWYKMAWSILDECGLTSYDDEYSCYDVYFRAIVLSMIYSDFCKLAFEEFDYYDCYAEKYEDEFEEIILGQLYAKLDDEELTDDKNHIVCELADAKRKEVFSALSSKMDIFTVFMGMYYTGISDYYISFDSYEEYWDMIINKPSELADNIISPEDMICECQGAYSWLCEGAYRIQ